MIYEGEDYTPRGLSVEVEVPADINEYMRNDPIKAVWRYQLSGTTCYSLDAEPVFNMRQIYCEAFRQVYSREFGK